MDKFDKVIGSLEGLPDTVKTLPATIITTMPLIGSSQTFIVQTFRQKESGDTIFIQYLDESGSMRIVVPPRVAEAIARQREVLTTKNRKKSAREVAANRKALGIRPAFLKGKKKASPAGDRV